MDTAGTTNAEFTASDLFNDRNLGRLQPTKFVALNFRKRRKSQQAVNKSWIILFLVSAEAFLLTSAFVVSFEQFPNEIGNTFGMRSEILEVRSL